MGANAPSRLNGTFASISYPPMPIHRSDFSWYTYDVFCSQLSSFKVPGALIRTQSPVEALWIELRSHIKNEWGPFGEHVALGSQYDGHPGLMHPSRKIQATSMLTEHAETVGYNYEDKYFAREFGFSKPREREQLLRFLFLRKITHITFTGIWHRLEISQKTHD